MIGRNARFDVAIEEETVSNAGGKSMNAGIHGRLTDGLGSADQRTRKQLSRNGMSSRKRETLLSEI